MPTSSCLASCHEHLALFNAQLPNLARKIEIDKARDQKTAVSSLKLSVSIARVALVEIKKMFDRHPLLLDSDGLCKKASDRALEIMEGLDPEDLKFLDQLHEVCPHMSDNRILH
jgi:hypothetical protein